MPKLKIIRCDEWRLLTEAGTVAMADETVRVYRRLANALASVFLIHWDQVHDKPVQDLERLFHATAKNPSPIYGAWFSRHFHKVPSYLRRAATMAAHGAVASFMARYRGWQGGNRRSRAQRPPAWGGIESWPVLYAANGGAGAMIRHHGDVVEIKLYDKATGEWLWKRAAVAQKGKRHDQGGLPKSPMLIVRGGSITLAQPYEFSRQARAGNPDRILAVDLGINKAATCVIVEADGTVTARRFISEAAHIDRRDKVLMQVRKKARMTMGNGGKLSQGFCQTLYRRAKGINLHIARSVARQIIVFAQEHYASCILFESLKGWRPKGGAKRSSLRQKFHGWMHRALVKQVEASAEERHLGVSFVSARGTSKWAYDGSGQVVREHWNYGRCRFRSGKHYDTDLSAAQNIAARYFWRRMRLLEQKTSPAGGNAGWPGPGRRPGSLQRASGTGPRMPVVLATLWQATVARRETPTTAASAA